LVKIPRVRARVLEPSVRGRGASVRDAVFDADARARRTHFTRAARPRAVATARRETS